MYLQPRFSRYWHLNLEKVLFSIPALFDAPTRRGEPVGISGWNLPRKSRDGANVQ